MLSGSAPINIKFLASLSEGPKSDGRKSEGNCMLGDEDYHLQLKNTGQWSVDRRSTVYLINFPCVWLYRKASHHNPERTLQNTYGLLCSCFAQTVGGSGCSGEYADGAPLLRLEHSFS